MSRFQKAVKAKKKLRMALMGPSGSGKTYTALAVAASLGQKVAVICTEFGSASLYADKFGFDVVDLDSYDPREYVDCIREAGSAGYDVLVIDSLSHAWNGKGGALELVDKAAKRDPRGNSFTAWRDVTPLHNQLVEAMLACPCHLIATMRTKTEYVIEDNGHGKKQPKKVGMAPVQRDGLEYEFDVVADLNLDHDFIVSKTRCDLLDGFIVNRAGAELGKTLLAWLDGGVDVSPPAPIAPADDNRNYPEFVAAAAEKCLCPAMVVHQEVYDQAVEAGHIKDRLRDNDQLVQDLAAVYLHQKEWVRQVVKSVVKSRVAKPSAA